MVAAAALVRRNVLRAQASAVLPPAVRGAGQGAGDPWASASSGSMPWAPGSSPYDTKAATATAYRGTASRRAAMPAGVGGPVRPT